VAEALSLKMMVKTPSGFKDDSLARPVIEVRNFIDGVALFEIFSFGEQVVVIPLKNKSENRNSRKPKKNKKKDLSSNIIKYLEYSLNLNDIDNLYIERTGTSSYTIYTDLELLEYLENNNHIILEIEDEYEVFIKVISNNNNASEIQIIEDKHHLILNIGKLYRNATVQIKIGPQIIMEAIADTNGYIKLARNKAITKRLERFIDTADSPLTVQRI
ncbi:MAG: hypothetical protein OEY49_20205, partial [Candidatus Heimdallarchaeota archaeon]|nr:hypothetical protein [Candidatus Heimdallarchaeota archaeon]